METRNVPDDIARGSGSFWLWLNAEFNEKALIFRGEVVPSTGPADPVVRRINDDVTIFWSGRLDSEPFSLRHFNGGPSTSDLEKMARARIAKGEYPPEDPAEEEPPGSHLGLVLGVTLPLPAAAILPASDDTARHAEEMAHFYTSLAILLLQLDTMNREYAEICRGFKNAGIELSVGADGRHSVQLPASTLPPTTNRPT